MIVGHPPSGGKKPTTPTIGTPTAGNGQVTVAFTASTYLGKGGTVTYRATSSPRWFYRNFNNFSNNRNRTN